MGEYLRKRRGFVLLLLALQLLVFCGTAWAAGGGGHGADIPKVLLSLVVVIFAAKIGGDVALRMKLPEVLGELTVGVVIGNLTLVGYEGLTYLRTDPSLEILAELGVILLLFSVGLETSIKEMLRVGPSSLAVAILGVVAPFFLGWGISKMFLGDVNELVHVFIGATLCATSVGITARVLKDLGKISTEESKIILGAAVIDDVLGLLVLAIVTGIIEAADGGATLATSAIVLKIVKAFGFLAAAIMIGSLLSPLMFRVATQLRAHGILLATSLVVCFGLSYLAALVELAPIVGAFTAGLILEPVHYSDLSRRNDNADIDELIAPIAALLVPVFFVSMGARVEIARFADWNILGFAFWLTVVSIIGKQVCSLGVLKKGPDRLLVGLGMIPRGEVGLIFAGIGYSLTLDGKQVIDSSTFGAVVFMVIVTTMITPPLIKWRFSSPRHRPLLEQPDEQELSESEARQAQ